MRALLVVAVALTASACEKAPPAEEKPANPAPVATPASAPTDSTGVKAATDTTATKAATKGEGPLRDSAFGPKYTVDEKGKVTPIKKP